MSQILLYLFLAGVALLLFAMTRPKSQQDKRNQDTDELMDVLQKFQYEQAALSTAVQQTLRTMEDRITRLEEQIQERISFGEAVGFDQSKLVHQTAQTQQAKQQNQGQQQNPQVDEWESSSPLSPRHKEVVLLLQQGKDITSVAKQTGVGVGEVQLLERLLDKQRGQGVRR